MQIERGMGAPQFNSMPVPIAALFEDRETGTNSCEENYLQVQTSIMHAHVMEIGTNSCEEKLLTSTNIHHAHVMD